MQAKVAYFYRQARNIAYQLLNPFDALFRKINRLEGYPPIHLRRHVSCLSSMDGFGFEYVAYLKLLLGLRAKHRIWDIGCGCGFLELALERAGWDGPLVGVDIHRPSIQWAQRTISRRSPNFQFVHADIYNPSYWPQGKMSATEWFSNFAEQDFDMAVAKSLFTHMLPHELELYLQQIKTRLKPTGKALLTFFLLNPVQDELKHLNRIHFVKDDPGSTYAVRYRLAPTAAVAYDETYIVDLLAKNGFQVSGEILYGWWTGRQNALSSQDIIIIANH